MTPAAAQSVSPAGGRMLLAMYSVERGGTTMLLRDPTRVTASAPGERDGLAGRMRSRKLRARRCSGNRGSAGPR